MRKNWLVATYKTNEVRRVESNLLKQGFDFYLPKIRTKKINSKPKVEALFPGYIFVNINLKDYSALKYTLGIKNIIKFGDNISCISHKEIEAMQMVEEKSKIDPVVLQIKIGQEVMIANGSLAGSIVKVCSLPQKDRVGIFLSFLGSIRRVSVSKKDLIF